MISPLFTRSANFYPRPPRGGRLSSHKPRNRHLQISIHALREEGDVSPCAAWASHARFLSTPSARRATCLKTLYGSREGISIHALREEGDQNRRRACGTGSLFLSTPSARRATGAAQLPCLASTFLSTPSARRATAKTETKSLFSNKLYNILHEFRRALIYNGSKNDPNHAK